MLGSKFKFTLGLNTVIVRVKIFNNDVLCIADSPADTTIEVTKLEPVSSKRRDETEKEVERRRNEVSSKKNNY
jgi:hypothetical protein